MLVPKSRFGSFIYPARSPLMKSKPADSDVTSPPVCDFDAALAALEGDRQLLGRMIEAFLAETSPLVLEMRDSIVHEHSVRLERAAHTLRGAVCNFVASNTYDAASRLQNFAVEKNWVAAGETLMELERELGDLIRALEGFRKGEAL